MSNGTEHVFTPAGGHAAAFSGGPADSQGRPTIEKQTLVTELMNYYHIKIVERERLAILSRHCPDVTAIQVPENYLEVFAKSKAATEQNVTAPVIPADRWIEFSLETKDLLQLVFTPFFEKLELLKYDDDLESKTWQVRMVDITAGIPKASIMDVKLGAVRHSPLTPADKVERMDLKEKGGLVRTTALRVCGALHNCNDAETNSLVRTSYGKELGHGITLESQLSNCLKLFLSTTIPLSKYSACEGSTTATAAEVEETKQQLASDADAQARIAACAAGINDLVQYFKSADGEKLLTELAFVSSSLLIVYDATLTPSSAAGKLTPDQIVHVYLIDFARSGPRIANFPEADIRFVNGLDNYLRFLE